MRASTSFKIKGRGEGEVKPLFVCRQHFIHRDTLDNRSSSDGNPIQNSQNRQPSPFLQADRIVRPIQCPFPRHHLVSLAHLSAALFGGDVVFDIAIFVVVVVVSPLLEHVALPLAHGDDVEFGLLLVLVRRALCRILCRIGGAGEDVDGPHCGAPVPHSLTPGDVEIVLGVHDAELEVAVVLGPVVFDQVGDAGAGVPDIDDVGEEPGFEGRVGSEWGVQGWDDTLEAVGFEEIGDVGE